MEGILVVMKPPGVTSHDVVNRVRRLAGVRKVGHSGTLDPEAAGILLLCLGRATKIVRFLKDDKEYEAEIVFGEATDTGDSDGRIQFRSDASKLGAGEVLSAVSSFRGTTEQIPPMSSAVHYRGKRLYELARQGIIVERAPRKVNIYDIQVCTFLDWGTSRPRAVFKVSCSAGTYIRSLCNDIGHYLGCGARMGRLLRTRVGAFDLSQAHTLEELAHLASCNEFEKAIIDINKALEHIPEINIEGELVTKVKMGNSFSCQENRLGGLETGTFVRVVDQSSKVIAIGKVRKICYNCQIIQPVRVLL